jgi:hypothetical protein
MDDHRAQQPPAGSATSEEAAAIVAAVERFLRATAAAQEREQTPGDPWREAAILEGVSRRQPVAEPHPWINT